MNSHLKDEIDNKKEAIIICKNIIQNIFIRKRVLNMFIKNINPKCILYKYYLLNHKNGYLYF